MSIDSLIRICGIGIIAAVTVMLIKEMKKETAQNTSFGIFALMLCFSLPLVGDIVQFTANLGKISYPEVSEYVSLVVKAIGISYITYISAEICKTAGEAAIAGQVELIGRLEIVLLCVPYFEKLISLAML